MVLFTRQLNSRDREEDQEEDREEDQEEPSTKKKRTRKRSRKKTNMQDCLRNDNIPITISCIPPDHVEHSSCNFLQTCRFQLPDAGKQPHVSHVSCQPPLIRWPFGVVTSYTMQRVNTAPTES